MTTRAPAVLINAALLLAKIAAIYVFLVLKLLGRKSGRINFLTNFKSEFG